MTDIINEPMKAFLYDSTALEKIPAESLKTSLIAVKNRKEIALEVDEDSQLLVLTYYDRNNSANDLRIQLTINQLHRVIAAAVKAKGDNMKVDIGESEDKVKIDKPKPKNKAKVETGRAGVKKKPGKTELKKEVKKKTTVKRKTAGTSKKRQTKRK